MEQVAQPSRGSGKCGRAEVPNPGNSSSPFGLSTYPFQHLLICVLDPSHILPKPILIHRLSGRHIPETAGIRRNFVCQDQLIVKDTELKLEVDKLHLPLGEEGLENFINREPELSQLAQEARRRNIHQPQMIVIDERV